MNAIVLTGFWETIWDWIVNWFKGFIGLDLLLKAIENNEPIPAQAYLNLICSSILALFAIFVLYRTLYIILGLFGKSRRFNKMPQDKRYAFLLPACNEELVIANLIDSIRKMDYPQELVDIYVIADNCTDKTAEIARSKGVSVTERNDPSKKRKGFGLQYFFNEFKKAHDVNEYYAYIIMDADNICAPTFLSRMNDGLQEGKYDAAIGYRNCKNLSENWVSAICGLNCYSNVIVNLRARSTLGTGQQIYGPSSTFRSYLLEDGWNWTTLCEDSEAFMELSAKNYKIGYVEDAVIYEEQPTKVNLFIKQNMRWTKGNLVAYYKFRHEMIVSSLKKPTWTKYDMFWQLFPYSLYTFYFSLLYQIVSLIFFFVFGDNGYSWSNFFNFFLSTLAGVYLGGFFTTVLTLIREWKKILLPGWKVPLYLFLFPLYQVINLPISAVAAFMKVSWKHIDHHVVADAEDLVEVERQKNKK